MWYGKALGEALEVRAVLLIINIYYCNFVRMYKFIPSEEVLLMNPVKEVVVEDFFCFGFGC